ncbi:hypothetical protein ONE63_011014 [Megalurothrips usitatus]|uniref:Odorant receptor n=1 Tax=Megalurothrips usitatus TaxID=439358 RepID=A0AAV7XLB9_9NEOP|nr:hypothetical protein ONE63_011014 [Megalurothrips usitatus]
MAFSWPADQWRHPWQRVLGSYVLPGTFLTTFVLPMLCVLTEDAETTNPLGRMDLVNDAVASSLVCFKLRCLQKHTPTLVEVRRLLHDCFAPMEAPVQAAASESNARCERRTARLSKGYMLVYSFMSWSGMAIVILSALTGDPADRKLTTKAPDGLLLNDYLYWVFLLNTAVEIYLFPIVTGIFDSLFLTLCLHIACKCDILWLLLQRLGREHEDGKVSSLKNCIRYHQLIIRLHQLTEGMYSGVTLYQTTYILFGIGVPVIRLTLGSPDSDRSKIIFDVAFACWNTGQLMTFCWFGDKVARMVSPGANKRLRPLPEAATATGHYLQLMTQRAQRPLYLTAGKFSNLTLRLCLDIVKRSYSLCSAIINVR